MTASRELAYMPIEELSGKIQKKEISYAPGRSQTSVLSRSIKVSHACLLDLWSKLFG